MFPSDTQSGSRYFVVQKVELTELIYFGFGDLVPYGTRTFWDIVAAQRGSARETGS